MLLGLGIWVMCIDSGTGLNKITITSPTNSGMTTAEGERETSHYKIKHPNIIGLHRTQHKQTEQ